MMTVETFIGNPIDGICQLALNVELPNRTKQSFYFAFKRTAGDIRTLIAHLWEEALKEEDRLGMKLPDGSVLLADDVKEITRAYLAPILDELESASVKTPNSHHSQ